SSFAGSVTERHRVPPDVDPARPQIRVVGTVRFGNLEIMTRLPGETERDALRRERRERKQLRDAETKALPPGRREFSRDPSAPLLSSMAMATPGAAPARLGRYELLARLAAGGMGEIFLARLEGAAGFEKLFVIKRILPHLADDERFRAMLIAEARIAS